MALPTVRASASDLLRSAATRLREAGIETARLDAEVLLALAMTTDRAGLYARLQQPADAASEQRLAAFLDRRTRREPIAYITGVQEFWSLPFTVNPAVLIPRPETELLVEIVCRLHRATAPGAGSAWSICDVGTGSGCVAVALARELPALRVVALDVSAAALVVAAANAAAHGVAARVVCTQSDLFAAVEADRCFDAIVSNPPYCRPGDSFSPEVGFEPTAALAAGADGLSLIRRLLAAAPARLRADGWLVMEFGRGQEAAVVAQARAAGFTSVEIEADLAGIPRVLVARRGQSGGPMGRTASDAR